MLSDEAIKDAYRVGSGRAYLNGIECPAHWRGLRETERIARNATLDEVAQIVKDRLEVGIADGKILDNDYNVGIKSVLRELREMKEGD